MWQEERKRHEKEVLSPKPTTQTVEPGNLGDTHRVRERFWEENVAMCAKETTGHTLSNSPALMSSKAGEKVGRGGREAGVGGKERKCARQWRGAKGRRQAAGAVWWGRLLWGNVCGVCAR